MARKNKCLELAELIRQSIVTGAINPGERLEAIAKLAKRHRTTVATVSKSLDILEQGGHVERFAGKGVYVKEKTSLCLALVIDDGFSSSIVSVSFLPIFIKELERACRALNWQLKLYFNVTDYESSFDFRQQLSSNNLDAVLVASRWLAENKSTLTQDMTLPWIGLFDYKDLATTFSLDLFNMTFNAVKTLHTCGCKQIALVHPDSNSSWKRTEKTAIDGYRNGLTHTGRLYNEDLDIATEISQNGGKTAFHTLKPILSKTASTGVIVSDSLITLGMVQVALANGVSIPEDLVIATHTNCGCQISAFPIPIIKYELDIKNEVDSIIKMIKSAQQGNIPPTGTTLLQPQELIPDSIIRSQ